ncbi:MAG: PD40 domain-containing protein [Chloroflexi bacterium]|nr:PD40 domain-containing protein [Chloroflexota bacterium]
MMDLDGSNKSSLVTNFGYSDQPAWSPNGKWISFISNQNRKTGEIYLYQFMGGEIIQISDGIGGYKLPRWSPDSVRLVFAKNNPGINYDNELYIVYLDGFRMEKLTKGGAFYGSPIWHP